MKKQLLLAMLLARTQGDRGTCPSCGRKDVRLFLQEPDDGSRFELCGPCENDQIDEGMVAERDVGDVGFRTFQGIILLVFLAGCYTGYVAPPPCLVTDGPVLDLASCDIDDLHRVTLDYGAAAVIASEGCEAVQDRLDVLIPARYGHGVEWENWPSCAEGVTAVLNSLKWSRFGGLWE